MASAEKNIFIETFEEIFSYLDFDLKFLNEVPLSTLSNVLQHNILVGVSGSMRGNIIFSFNVKTFRELAACMMGSEKANEEDIFAVSAVADLFTEFCKRLIKFLNRNKEIFLSSPIGISGNGMTAMISPVPSKNLFFKLNGERLAIAYYLEEI